MNPNDIMFMAIIAQVSIIALCFFYFLLQNISITFRIGPEEYKSEPPEVQSDLWTVMNDEHDDDGNIKREDVQGKAVDEALRKAKETLKDEKL